MHYITLDEDEAHGDICPRMYARKYLMVKGLGTTQSDCLSTTPTHPVAGQAELGGRRRGGGPSQSAGLVSQGSEIIEK